MKNALIEPICLKLLRWRLFCVCLSDVIKRGNSFAAKHFQKKNTEPSQKKFFLEGKQQEEDETPLSHLDASSYSENIPSGQAAELFRPRVESEATKALQAFDRYQGDDGSALPLLGLPRASSSSIGASL